MLQFEHELFVDKATEKIHFVSPVSGTVAAIVRGDRRKLLHVSVQSDGKQTCRQDSPIAIDKASGSDILASLLKAGLFAFVRQRPYDVIASPEVMPKAIFVSAFSKMPLAADFSFAVEGHEDDFKTGLRALAKLEPMQQSDFEGIYEAMEGCPVTIRFLDPPPARVRSHRGGRHREAGFRNGQEC